MTWLWCRDVATDSTLALVTLLTQAHSWLSAESCKWVIVSSLHCESERAKSRSDSSRRQACRQWVLSLVPQDGHIPGSPDSVSSAQKQVVMSIGRREASAKFAAGARAELVSSKLHRPTSCWMWIPGWRQRDMQHAFGRLLCASTAQAARGDPGDLCIPANATGKSQAPSWTTGRELTCSSASIASKSHGRVRGHGRALPHHHSTVRPQIRPRKLIPRCCQPQISRQPSSHP